MIIQNPILTGSVALNGLNLTANNLATTSSNSFTSDQSITGSLGISANTTIAGTLTVTGSIVGLATSASYVLNAVSSSKAVSASYSDTASFANSFNVAGNLTASNAVLSGTLTAQTLVVQTITSSIVYSSGSNNFGNQLANTQTFTGSVNITGSLALAGNISGNAVTLTGALDGTSATFSGNNHSLASNNTLRFTDTDTATEANQQIGKIEFYSSDSSTPGAGVKAYIGAFAQDTTPDAYLSFATQDGSATPNPVERLRISSEGLATFSSSVTATDQIKVSGGGAYLSIYDTQASSKNWAIRAGHDAVGDLAIRQSNSTGGDPVSAGTTRLYINTSGFVGIGTTNPTGSLDVSGSVYIRSSSGGVLYIPRMADQSRGLSIGEQTSLGSKSAVIRTAGGVSEHLFLDPGFNNSNVAGNIALVYANTGNVGIGTYLPVGKLDINTGGNRNVVISNDSTDTGYNIVSLNGSRTKGVYAGIAGGGTADNNLYLNSGVDIVFQTGASFTQRMRTVNEFTLAGSAAGTGGPTQVIGTTSMCGILFVSIGTQNCAAVFIINAASAPVLVSQTIAETRFSITSNSGNTANVYVSGTNIELQNNIQATRTFYCQFFGKL